MPKSKAKTSSYKIINPSPEHFEAIQKLCKRVYPFSKPWSIAQLEAHQSYFREGQFVAIDEETGLVVGLAFSLIISWSDYSPYDNWQDFTSAGFFHNHNPRKGKTLYGAEVMVDPQYRGRGIAKMLYKARQELAKRYNLKRIRAGARLVGYSKFQDKLTPDEYTKKVIEKQIYDPTLSFQLGQGFVVLDVAKNYLLNDPESLGYAAVIEWLNPDSATEVDYKKQKQSVHNFLTNQYERIEHLPMQLRKLVRKATGLLGEVIKEHEGVKFYERIERYRQKLKKTRSSSQALDLAYVSHMLKSENREHQFKIAHSFSLLLEIINVCESAYRTWRLRQRPMPQTLTKKVDLCFVLTAHPTEARSQVVVNILDELTNLFVNGLNHNFIFSEATIMTYMRMLWIHPLVKTKAPSVIDEAEYIHSLIFTEAIADFLFEPKQSYELNLRTWVGGDKDGHPGVDHVTMRKSLSASRKHLVNIFEKKLNCVLQDIENVGGISNQYKPIQLKIKRLIKGLKDLYELNHGDGRKAKEWRSNFLSFVTKADYFTKKHHFILDIQKALQHFPALVLPLELREDAQEIALALKDPKKPIYMMLTELMKICDRGMVTDYVRGFVISNCESEEDLAAANRLVWMACRTKVLPVIPLFESANALRNAKSILSHWFKDKSNLDQVRLKWNNQFEVMLGYSDSAKKMGVLPSRFVIRQAMIDIESALKAHSVQPIFFHGSGGSVARGGGSLREQIAWWPNSAISLPKLTVQGEMIQRLFATREILNSQCLHLSNEAKLRRGKSTKIEKNKTLDKLSRDVEQAYEDLVSDSKLLSFCLDATPYHYLNILKIGSRPAKRAAAVASVDSLRAIPWVLCWTQTRLLFPTWWGIGSAWKRLKSQERKELMDLFKKDPLFSSYVKVLGFTLAKVELGIWDRYLFERHGNAASEASKIFHKEFNLAVRFVKDITQSNQLIAHKPWLEESIRLRAPYIHILNLLQISAMKENNEKLLKETLVGIACGMLTTG